MRILVFDSAFEGEPWPCNVSLTLILTFSIYCMVLKDGKKTGCKIEYPALDCQFTGTGDLFSALLLVWSHKHPSNLQVRFSSYFSYP